MPARALRPKRSVSAVPPPGQNLLFIFCAIIVERSGLEPEVSFRSTRLKRVVSAVPPSPDITASRPLNYLCRYLLLGEGVRFGDFVFFGDGVAAGV